MKRLIRGRVNIGQPSYTPLAYVNQLDDITLELDVYNGNSPLDVTGQTVSLYAKRSNTTVVEQLSGLSTASTKVTGDVKNSCFAVPGITEMQLEFTDSTGKTTVSSFYINVNKSLSSEDSITAGNEIAILTEAKKMEPIRQENERGRVEAEKLRVQSETDRAAAEEIREQQELARQTCYKEIEESRKDFDGGIHKNLKLRLMRDFGDIYKRFNKANLLLYEAEYISASNSYKGMTTDNVVKGRTLQNLVGSPLIQATGGKIEGETIIIDTTSNSIDGGIQFKGANLVKPSNVYTICYEVLSNENFTGLFSIDGASVYCFDAISLPKTVGEHKVKLTSRTTWSTDLIKISTTSLQGKGKLVIKTKMMLLEGDYTNKPIPSYFEGIKSVNEGGEILEEVSCGKNLIDITKIGKFIGDDTFEINLKSDMYEKGICNNCSTSKVTISYYAKLGTATNFRCDLVYDINSYTSTAAITQGTNFEHRTVTSDINKPVTKIRFNWSSIGTVFIKNLQIEISPVKTDYEPYQEHRQTTKMKNLRSLPNGVCDTSDGVRRIGKIVLDGVNENLNYALLTTRDTTAVFSISGVDKKKGDVNFISDRFITMPQFTANIENMNGRVDTNTLVLEILKDRINTPDIRGLKTWLQSNPITVYYELASPTNEEGNKEELRTYDGITNIFTEGSLIEPTISVKIPSNVQAVVMNLREENQTLNNDVNTLQATTEENNLMNIETNVKQEARLTMLELGVI